MEIIGNIDAAALSCLIEALYEAAQDADAWRRVMVLLCQHLSADSGLIRFYAPDWSEVTLSITHEFDTKFDAAYSQHFVQVDPIPRALEGLPSGTMAFLDEVVPFTQLKRTEFYGDYMVPQDKRHIMGGYVYNEGGAKAVFGVQRGRRGRPFEHSDRALLKALAPHFIQTFRIHQALTEARVSTAALNLAVDALRIAVFFLSEDGRVLFANRSAEMMVRKGRILTVRHGYLHAASRDSDASLQRLIHSVTKGSRADSLCLGGAVQITPARPETDALTAVVAPRRRLPSGNMIGPRIVAAVFVGTRARVALRPDLLAGAYGLTRTEARFAVKLVETCDVELSAAAIGVTRNTARAYLKSIFRKTDCHSQIEFIRLILSSPIGLWGRVYQDSLE